MLKGVADVYSTTGRYDLAVVVRATDAGALLGLITNRLLPLAAILHAKTLVAFRVHPRYALEHIFSLHMESWSTAP